MGTEALLNTDVEAQDTKRMRQPGVTGVILITLITIFFGGLTGCGKNDRDLRSGAEELFERGNKAMKGGNYRNSIAYFEALEARYPFSNQAKQAQLNLIYSYYRNGEPEAAIDAAIQFERENPTHPRVDYALYMQGIANFSGQHTRMHRLFRFDLSKRPPVKALESFSAFSRLVQRYPDSRYAADARQRMVFLRNRLAEHQNHVANYYLRRGAYAAALNRAKFSMETFDGAPAVSDSLFIMISAYEQLGMKDLAESMKRVLAENYPDAEPPPEVKKKWFYFF
jgi:outer membrane protein assembly factor BamD